MFGTQNYGGGFTQQGGASYRPQQAQQQSAESLSLDDVMQGGAPSAFSKDDPIGTSVEGEIVEIRAEQQTDFTTGEPLYYPNGKAKPQVVIHLQTSLQDPDRVGDSGIRGVYVKGYNIGQLRLACRQAGVGDHPNVGDRLKATFARTQPAKTRGYNDAKIYDYVVTPKKQSDLSAAMNDPQAGQQQYAPQQPQQSAYGQPTTIGQPAGLTASDRQTISQLAAAGKTASDKSLNSRPVMNSTASAAATTVADACSKHDESLREETYGNGTGWHSGQLASSEKRHMCHSVPKLWHSGIVGIPTKPNIYIQLFQCSVVSYICIYFVVFVLCV